MQTIYGDQCVDLSTVRCWVRRFKDGELGQADLSDKTRSGRQVMSFIKIALKSWFTEIVASNKTNLLLH